MAMFGNDEQASRAHIDDIIKRQGPDGGTETIEVKIDLEGDAKSVSEGVTQYKRARGVTTGGPIGSAMIGDASCEECDDEKRPKSSWSLFG